MITFTIDTNCVIDLEQNSSEAPMLRALVGAHRAQEADVAIPAVAALERQAGGGYLEHFDLFLARLENAGLHGLTIVHSIAEWNVGFYGVGYIPNAPMIELERRIHAVLHPDVESSLADFCGARGLNPGNRPLPHRWRNAKCDVQMLWSHIHHQRSCFVTRDGNFRKASKVPKLLELGAGQILGPNEAAELLKPAA